MTLIAFDHGTHKIGVASGNAITGTATPLPALACRDGQPDWDRVTALLEEWRPETLVVGLPLNMDGSESESSQRARKFARRLHGRFGIRVWMIDERLSTREARERTGTRRADPKVDSMAAAVIAEGYLGGATPVAP
ncbi:MAG: Holliday junction resolvase RuvX [Alloalcanivorax venustensis]|uniref:Holliday junction resolvase RuvX n=1 Tax=Alloalcanivorax venustensis TaxID=172371 RepID=UPI00115E6CF8|nr:Holliday junction resolvase RuvX [Alcanivorax sp.]MED5603212.1 Holliday junction resolvase RuvX [Pseudomonadota bacterium]SMO45637.1 putative holliday junction resolvase [Alcanivorax sp. DSM 26295]